MKTIATTTHYYFYETNAEKGICVTDMDNKRVYFCRIDSNGNDTNTGVNIYNADYAATLEALKTAYNNLYEKGLLYDFDGIETDFSDDIHDFNPAEFEKLELIIDAKSYLS